jgi:hypothetical protein
MADLSAGGSRRRLSRVTSALPRCTRLPGIMIDCYHDARPDCSSILLDMGKGKKNASKAKHLPRAPRTTLDFIENGDKKFEELARDLMAEEPGIEDAHLYGRQRQVQYGIDVWADRAKDSAHSRATDFFRYDE